MQTHRLSYVPFAELTYTGDGTGSGNGDGTGSESGSGDGSGSGSGDGSGSGTGTGTGNVETPIDELVEYWKWVEDTYGIDISAAIAEHGKAGKELLELYGNKKTITCWINK